MDSITRNLYNGGWSLQPKYNNNRKTFLPGPQRQIKIMQSEFLIGVGCGSLEASRCAPETPAPGSPRPAGWPACAPVWVQTARPTSTWALIQDTPRPQKPPARKLSSEDEDQGAVNAGRGSSRGSTSAHNSRGRLEPLGLLVFAHTLSSQRTGD